MLLPGKMTLGCLQEDNPVKFYFRVRPLLIKEEDGCRIGVISDTWPNIESQLRYLGIDQYFDQLTYSYRLGCSKPDPAMFEDAVRKAGMPADQILFIDDLAGNLAAAEKTGMHGALSIADPRTKEDPRFPSVARPADVYHILQAD